tara:strand:+ start:985 stop:1089 length:105 start_codon:yes stop_codon:yes gene_type:complete
MWKKIDKMMKAGRLTKVTDKFLPSKKKQKKKKKK